jgi:catecholate siderophore receptor
MPPRALVRRITCVLLAALLVLVVVRSGSASDASQAVPLHRVDIQAGPLDRALDDLGAATGATVLVSNGARLDGLVSPGAAGILTLDQALAQLLAGTGLTARLTAPATYTLEVQGMTETIEVTGHARHRAVTAEIGTRTDTPLRDVPQAVTVVTRATIDDQSMQSLGDVLRYVPGVGTAQGEGNRDNAVFRGNSSTSDFFVDGLRDDVQYYRDLYNVERVEVLKGPNAMLFGRGGAGGVVNRATRQADWSRTREVVLQGGTYGNRRTTADLGDRLGNAAAARTTVLYENSGSHRDGVSVERYGVNPTLAFTPGAQTLLRVGYEYFHDERTADRGVPSWGPGPVPTPASAFYGDPDGSVSRADVNALSLSGDHRFGQTLAVRNRTRLASYDKFYQNVYASGAVSADGATVPLGAYNNATGRLNVFTQTDLISTVTTGAVRHVLLYGAEFGRQETDNVRMTGHFASGSTTLRVPADQANVRVPVTYRPGVTDADNSGVARAAAAYVQDQVELTRHVSAVIGLRFDDFEVDFMDNRTGRRFGSSDRLLAPRAGAVVKPAEPVSLYASYSLAYVPRAGEQLASLTLSNQALEPEQFRNYEIGAKWDARPSLDVTAALYRLDRQNVVVPDPADPTRSILVDGQRSQGLEIGVNGLLASAWQVTGAYALQHGELTSTLSPSARQGAVLAQLPRHTFSMWNRYDVSRVWAVGLGVIYRDAMFTSTDNTVSLPSFLRVDAAAYWNVSTRLRVQVNVENLFDTSYYATAHNNFNVTPGAPFHLRAALTARF